MVLQERKNPVWDFMAEKEGLDFAVPVFLSACAGRFGAKIRPLQLSQLAVSSTGCARWLPPRLPLRLQILTTTKQKSRTSYDFSVWLMAVILIQAQSIKKGFCFCSSYQRCFSSLHQKSNTLSRRIPIERYRKNHRPYKSNSTPLQ